MPNFITTLNMNWRELLRIYENIHDTIERSCGLFKRRHFCVTCGLVIAKHEPCGVTKRCSDCADDKPSVFKFCHTCGINCGDVMYCNECDELINVCVTSDFGAVAK